MRRSNKKSFDWYGTKQQFSIRKYHFGAASVLLGVSLVLGAGAQVVKADETVASSEPTIASSVAPASTEAVAEEAEKTNAENTSAVATTSTEVEKAKAVLEQVTSESPLLAGLGQKELAKTEDATLAEAVADVQAKLAAAKAILADSEATVEQVEAQVAAVKAANEALGNELQKYTVNGLLTAALDTVAPDTTASTLKVGDGEGTLLDRTTTATPSMAEPNGATIAPHTLRDKVEATKESGWYTFGSYDLLAYDVNQAGALGGSALNAYMRYSLDNNPSTTDILAELVEKTTGKVLESHTLMAGSSATFVYPRTINEKNRDITLTYSVPNTLTSTPARVQFSDGVLSYALETVPAYQVNTTRYITESGNVLATYNLQTIAGQKVTSSAVRTFTGYDYVKTTQTVVQGAYPKGAVYLAGVGSDKDGKNRYYKAITEVVEDNQYAQTFYVLDPAYAESDVDWTGTNTTGFLPLLKTSTYKYNTADKSSYIYNTNTEILSPFTEEDGYMVFKVGPENSQGSKWRIVAKWSGTDITDPNHKDYTGGKYGRIYISKQVWTTAKEIGITEKQWIDAGLKKFDNNGIIPVGTNHSLRNAAVATAYETTHIYKENSKYGDVIVEYYDTEGKQIVNSVVDTPKSELGTQYNTDADHRPDRLVAADGTVYFYKEVKSDSAKTTGTVVAGTTTVKYVYEKAGNVNVNFVDINGKVIKAPVSDEKDAKPGYNYDTDLDQKLASITFEGKVYKLVPAGDYPVGKVGKGNNLIAVGNNTAKGIDPTTGKIEAGVNKEVTYVYKAVTGSVVVNYKDTEGNVIKDPETDVSDAPVGDAYTTTDKKPNEIITKDGSRYVLVPSKTDGEENGKVIEGTITVTYVYQKVANWIPEIPNVPETDRPKVPYPFDPTEPDEPIDPTTPGTNGEVPNIPYVPGYTPVDPKDNTPLKPIDPNDPGKGYVPPTPENPGVDTPIPYVPVKKVVTNHVDEEGNPIAPQEEGTKPNKSIPGYEFTGKTVTDEDGNTTHIYKKTPEVKNGTVVVNYVTEDGTVIKEPVTDTPTSPEGTPYDTTDNKPKTITFKGEEYELVRVDGTENGKVVEGETVVTYVYRKVETPAKKVVTNHVDEEGNPVAPQEEGTKPNKSIPGYEFTGKTVTDEDGNTTHIYKKTPEVKNGTVVVNYVTEDGTVIKEPVTDTPTSPEGTPYDTTDNKPKTITFKGEEYELVRVDGTENGKVVEGETVVTYVYRKVETPAKKVVTNHVDEEGNPVAPQEEGTKPNKSIPGYEFTGKTVTDEDGNTTHIYKKTPAKKVVTNHVDEEGNPIAPQEDGTTPKRQISGYEYVRTVVDEEGNTTHIYRKLSNKPTTPEKETPAKPQAGKTASGKAQLPNTGEASSVAGALGTAMLVATLAFARKRRRNED
ncbi:MucBP domain-containing protein [Streptococcus suis]|uniref:MucBP domain-containing protein n=5 Tax=Streptococcus suis TaxID=1307 RepID=UPI00094457B9|nr:MucBP domain-containing protein [Streptococcus suis]MCO0825499.1 MucBP domain-containing protein [Streptococcus suis]MCO0827498.1 MucBP domain-containing protein [Streptococcus suis]MCO0846003.1 MucBP domain-containing protein [Streptococcus suis]MCO0853593.1 MucBP domain-containing protein [Streptococcus suis]MDW8643455.1 MucBP domain-containing protein [Streptococcus suis]